MGGVVVMSAHLFLFQIGPVQTFIAQARRTQDLFVGSYILSALARAGITEARKLPGFKPIFPVIDQAVSERAGVPHRFAFLCDADPKSAAERVRTAIQMEWLQAFADPVFRFVTKAVGEGDWQATFERQKLNWMEFYWASIEATGDHAEVYKKVSAALAQRKYARTFHQADEPGVKCTLTGAQSALELNWGELRRALYDDDGIILRPNERLGTLALIKRLAAKAREYESIEIPDFERFPSTDDIASGKQTKQSGQNGARASNQRGKEVTGYLAVLHMDGDQMGKQLSELKSPESHQEFSKKLDGFAKEARNIVKNHGGETGVLVYAGGDDVLALLPLQNALRCALELHDQFTALTGCKASAGIAITPANLPLDRALELSREAEETAKEQYGRNAVVVTEAHGTGQLRDAGGKWDIIKFILELQSLFMEDALSGKLGYELRMLDHDLFGDLRRAREAEIRRIVGRRTSERATSEQKARIKTLTETMIKLVEDVVTEEGKSPYRPVPTWSDMANWVILARFLAQGGKRERSEGEARA
jgi:CRISPR-associated protein Cmr2